VTMAANRSGRNERRLREKSWLRTAMRLRGVDKEGMAKINRSGGPCSKFFPPGSAFRETVHSEFS
jgi:hypothetical protein